MPWIKMTDEQDAMGELAEIYRQGPTAWISDPILRVHSLNPQSLKAHLSLFRTLIYGTSGLTRVQREMIGVVVSTVNRCQY